MARPILCLDFDGTIHSYVSGWQGAEAILDPPTSGAIEFIRKAMIDFTIVIVSSRFNNELRRVPAILAMRQWLTVHGLNVPVLFVSSWPEEPDWPLDAIIITDVRPPALVTIDDRALTFDGTWPALETLKAFRPWNKRSAP